MQNRIIILYDHSGFFATKIIEKNGRRETGGMDVRLLEAGFASEGFSVTSRSFAEVDFTADAEGVFVLYASSEDRGMFYKQYIADVLLALREKGAVLIPGYTFFSAHSNKVLQEMLRKSFRDERLRIPASVAIGEAGELRHVAEQITFPAVVKLSGGSGSRGVERVDTKEAMASAVRRMMTHFYGDCYDTPYKRFGLFIKRVIRRVIGRRVNGETLLRKLHTNRIIIQEMIPGLTGDYKVLFFFGRYFVLQRDNRDGDFRASGSGKFHFPKTAEEVGDVLSLAKAASEEITSPLLSLDICRGKDACYLLEFQCVFFGPYTLQYAPVCFFEENGRWGTESGPFELEKEYVRAISAYIRSGMGTV